MMLQRVGTISLMKYDQPLLSSCSERSWILLSLQQHTRPSFCFFPGLSPRHWPLLHVWLYNLGSLLFYIMCLESVFKIEIRGYKCTVRIIITLSVGEKQVFIGKALNKTGSEKIWLDASVASKVMITLVLCPASASCQLTNTNYC